MTQPVAQVDKGFLEFLTALCDHLPLGVALVNAAERVTYVNPATLTLLHIMDGEVVGEPVHTLLAALARLGRDPIGAEEQLGILYEHSRQQKGTLTFETSLLAPPMCVTVFPLVEEKRDVSRVITCTFAPTTLHSTHNNDNLFGTLARHIQTPLKHMAAEATGLTTPSRRWDSTTLYQIGHGIAEEARGIQEALATLAEIYTLRGSAATLRLAPVELGDLMMTLIPHWQEQAPYHTFELALPGELPTVSADQRRVEEALNILMEFAVMLAPAGGTVRVDVRPRGEEVVVSIRHGGYRIPQDDVDRLWEPFHQIAGLPGVKSRGGLGLTLAETIIALHGGSLRAETPATGAGSVFVAAWPIVSVTLAQITSPAKTALAEDGAQDVERPLERIAAPRARLVALVCEGDQRMLRYLRANLEAQKFRCLTASDLTEAQRLAELDEPDVILLDTRCSNMESVESLRRIRDACAAPIITLTRRYDPEECVQLLDHGAVDYIVKPFSMEELLARVRVALRLHEARMQSGQREQVFKSGELTIDFAQRTVTVAGTPVALSKTEFKLLRTLAQHPGMVLSHEALLENVWGAAYLEEIEFVWVYIRRLRRKIEPDPSHPRYIQTVQGVGYRLAR